MTEILSERVLTVFWKGDEMPGIICYGYWPGLTQPVVLFPDSAWPDGTAISDTWLHNWQDGDSDWRVLRRDIMTPEWPAHDDWLDCVRKTLDCIVRAGALIAWCATEGHFADPPELFRSEQMEGGMWAVCGRELPFECSAELGKPFKALPLSTVLAVQAAAERIGVS